MNEPLTFGSCPLLDCTGEERSALSCLLEPSKQAQPALSSPRLPLATLHQPSSSLSTFPAPPGHTPVSLHPSRAVPQHSSPGAPSATQLIVCEVSPAVGSCSWHPVTVPITPSPFPSPRHCSRHPVTVPCLALSLGWEFLPGPIKVRAGAVGQQGGQLPWVISNISSYEGQVARNTP